MLGSALNKVQQHAGVSHFPKTKAQVINGAPKFLLHWRFLTKWLNLHPASECFLSIAIAIPNYWGPNIHFASKWFFYSKFLGTKYISCFKIVLQLIIWGQINILLQNGFHSKLFGDQIYILLKNDSFKANIYRAKSSPFDCSISLNNH